MNFRLIIFILFSICTVSSAQEFNRHILFLASSAMHGRAPATVDEMKAAAYVQHELIDAGCPIVFFQHFPFEKDTGINVIGMLDLRKDSTIIITAHYDHLGDGLGKSNEVRKTGIHPGADDNASGVAMMIEIAKKITAHKKWNYNFIFIGLSAHEVGLFGADYFSKSEMCSTLKIRAVLNFDMVGRLNTTYPVVRVSGIQTDEFFKEYFKVLQMDSLNIRPDDSNISQSDLKPFAEKKLPVLNFTTGIHEDYHKITDTPDKINYIGMEKIFQMVFSLLSVFALK